MEFKPRNERPWTEPLSQHLSGYDERELGRALVTSPVLIGLVPTRRPAPAPLATVVVRMPAFLLILAFALYLLAPLLELVLAFLLVLALVPKPMRVTPLAVMLTPMLAPILVPVLMLGLVLVPVLGFLLVLVLVPVLVLVLAVVLGGPLAFVCLCLFLA